MKRSTLALTLAGASLALALAAGALIPDDRYSPAPPAASAAVCDTDSDCVTNTLQIGLDCGPAHEVMLAGPEDDLPTCKRTEMHRLP